MLLLFISFFHYSRLAGPLHRRVQSCTLQVEIWLWCGHSKSVCFWYDMTYWSMLVPSLYWDDRWFMWFNYDIVLFPFLYPKPSVVMWRGVSMPCDCFQVDSYHYVNTPYNIMWPDNLITTVFWLWDVSLCGLGVWCHVILVPGPAVLLASPW